MAGKTKCLASFLFVYFLFCFFRRPVFALVGFNLPGVKCLKTTSTSLSSKNAANAFVVGLCKRSY